jgi:hypothetical protein
MVKFKVPALARNVGADASATFTAKHTGAVTGV